MKRFLLLSLLLITIGSQSVSMAQQRHADGVDDVLQYLPYATVFAFKTAGMDSRHEWPQLAATTVASWVASAGAGYVLKHEIREWRPDSTDMRSFPSGHTIFAFAGATMLRHEFGHVSPWISVGGYAVATLTAIDRVHRDRHHWHDVAAGAIVGVCAAELTCYLSNRILKNDRVAIGLTGQGVDVAVRW